MTTLKNAIFTGFFRPFSIFLFFFCFYFSNIKSQKQKMQFSFRKPHVWHPHNFAKKTLFWHNVPLFAFLNMPKKHYKNGENQWKTNLDQFLTQLLDQF